MITRKAPLKMRLWSKTNLPNSEGCMIWTGTLDDDGYGVFKARGKMLKAHRVSLILATGENKDLLVAHSCRNRNCVAPAHLEWKTFKGNTEDRRRDGTLLLGERNPMTKFNPEDIVAIRSAYETGKLNQPELAEKYGVGQNTISRIVRREVWKEV